MLIQGRLERTDTNLMHFKWEVTRTHGNLPDKMRQRVNSQIEYTFRSREHQHRKYLVWVLSRIEETETPRILFSFQERPGNSYFITMESLGLALFHWYNLKIKSPMKLKRGCVFWSFFKIDLCSATFMESSHRDLLNDMAEHRPI